MDIKPVIMATEVKIASFGIPVLDNIDGITARI